MATEPTCVGTNAGGTAVQDYMTALHARLAAAPGDFTVDNVVGSPVTSFTLTHTTGFQMNYRVSGGVILSLIAPSGGIANSAAPGTPTGAYAEDTILPAPSGTSTRYQFAQYGDAFLFLVNDTTNLFSVYGIHMGKIRVVNDGADVSGGLGTLAYLPTNSASSMAFTWFSTNGTAGNRKCYMRYAAAAWGSPSLLQAPGSYSGQVTARLGDLPCQLPDAGAAPMASSATRGVFKYLRVDTTTTAGAPLSVLPDGGSNQGWLRINNTNSTTRMVALWNDTVTP